MDPDDHELRIGRGLFGAIGLVLAFSCLVAGGVMFALGQPCGWLFVTAVIVAVGGVSLLAKNFDSSSSTR